MWILTIRMGSWTEYRTIGGVYDTAEKAKEAACFQLQAEALGETIEWTEIYNGDEHQPQLCGYEIPNGRFKEYASIRCKRLNDLY